MKLVAAPNQIRVNLYFEIVENIVKMNNVWLVVVLQAEIPDWHTAIKRKNFKRWTKPGKGLSINDITNRESIADSVIQATVEFEDGLWIGNQL